VKKITTIIIAGLLLAGCSLTPGSGNNLQPTPGASETSNSLKIENFSFSPTSITVKAGETVSVTNKDVAGHSVTADDGKSFDTGIIGKDQSVTFTAPTTPGTYPFHCIPHPSIKGVLMVK